MDERRREIPSGVDTSWIGPEISKEILQPPSLAQRLRDRVFDNKTEVISNLVYLGCIGLIITGGWQGRFELCIAGLAGVGITSFLRALIQDTVSFRESGSDQSGYIKS